MFHGSACELMEMEGRIYGSDRRGRFALATGTSFSSASLIDSSPIPFLFCSSSVSTPVVEDEGDTKLEVVDTITRGVALC